MGATVNTLAIDNGDLLALQQARRNVLGKCKVKSLKLTPREEMLATYVVNANFTRVIDNLTGIEVNTRMWKKVWSNGYPSRIRTNQVIWVLHRRRNIGRLEDTANLKLRVNLVDEGVWQASLMWVETRSVAYVAAQWDIQAATEAEVIELLTPVCLILAKVAADRYGTANVGLVNEQTEAWDKDFKRARSLERAITGCD